MKAELDLEFPLGSFLEAQTSPTSRAGDTLRDVAVL